MEQNITHIHSVGNTYAVATELKYILVLRDGITVEKAKCMEPSQGGMGTGTGMGMGTGAVISGFKITGDSLIVAVDAEIFIYFRVGGNYLGSDVRRIKIEHGIPIHISMTSIPKVFLVITK